MSDFTINIDSKLDLSKAKSEMDSFINSYKNSPLQIKVELDPKSINTANFGKQIQSSFSSAGSNAGKAFTKNMESSINTKSITELVNRLNSKGISQNIVSGAEKSLNTLTKAGIQINKIREVFSNDKLVSLKIDGVDSLGNAVSVVDKLNTKTKEWTTTTSYSSNSIKNIAKSFSQLDAQTASNKTLTWLKNNSKAAKDYGVRLRELAELQRTATNADDLKNYTKQVNKIKAEAASAGKTGASFTAEFKRAAVQIGQFASIYGGWRLVGNSIRESVSQLKEMDSILTEISKVSDMTNAQLTQLGKDAFDYASKYGKKVTDYLQGVTEMNRSGFYGQQGIDLANTSVLAQAAGNMSADVANSYLLATNAAYEFAGSAEKLNAVLDGQNMINIVVMPCRKLMAS